MSRYARLVRKRETSGPSLMRLMGLVKGGGLVRSRISRVGPFLEMDAMIFASRFSPIVIVLVKSIETVGKIVKRFKGGL